MKLRMATEFTLKKAMECAIGDCADWTADTMLYMQGEDWGGLDDEIGTMADWEVTIPAAESDAKYVGFYDWYISDHGRPDAPFAKTWADYRNYLLTQLREIEIYDDDDEDD